MSLLSLLTNSSILFWIKALISISPSLSLSLLSGEEEREEMKSERERAKREREREQRARERKRERKVREDERREVREPARAIEQSERARGEPRSRSRFPLSSAPNSISLSLYLSPLPSLSLSPLLSLFSRLSLYLSSLLFYSSILSLLLKKDPKLFDTVLDVDGNPARTSG